MTTISVGVYHAGMTDFWPQEANHLMYRLNFTVNCSWMEFERYDQQIVQTLESVVPPESLYFPKHWKRKHERDVYVYDLEWITLARLVGSDIAKHLKYIHCRVSPLRSSVCYSSSRRVERELQI